MPVSYSQYSPYSITDQSSGYLGLWQSRTIYPEADDVLFEIPDKYHHRPDLLSYDLYDTVKLWWVFAIRNPNIIQDPIFDLVSGMTIYLPKISSINSALGV